MEELPSQDLFAAPDLNADDSSGPPLPTTPAPVLGPPPITIPTLLSLHQCSSAPAKLGGAPQSAPNRSPTAIRQKRNASPENRCLPFTSSKRQKSDTPPPPMSTPPSSKTSATFRGFGETQTEPCTYLDFDTCFSPLSTQLRRDIDQADEIAKTQRNACSAPVPGARETTATAISATLPKTCASAPEQRNVQTQKLANGEVLTAGGGGSSKKPTKEFNKPPRSSFPPSSAPTARSGEKQPETQVPKLSGTALPGPPLAESPPILIDFPDGKLTPFDLCPRDLAVLIESHKPALSFEARFALEKFACGEKGWSEVTPDLVRSAAELPIEDLWEILWDAEGLACQSSSKPNHVRVYSCELRVEPTTRIVLSGPMLQGSSRAMREFGATNLIRLTVPKSWPDNPTKGKIPWWGRSDPPKPKAPTSTFGIGLRGTSGTGLSGKSGATRPSNSVPPSTASASASASAPKKTFDSFKTKEWSRHLGLKRVLNSTLRIGGKNFVVCGIPGSGTRDGQIAFMAQGDSAQPLRKKFVEWHGDAKEIENFAKCVSRLGMCLSASSPTITLTPDQIVEIPDVFTCPEDPSATPHCLTDGCGEISWDLMEKVKEKMEWTHNRSAIQIRMLGMKGMLVVNKNIDNCIRVRPSMIKFRIDEPTANQMVLEVKGSSSDEELQCGSLNREIIVLLSALGVRDEIFYQILEESLQPFQKEFTKKDAKSLLRSMIFRPKETADEDGTTENGYDGSSDRFFTPYKMLRAGFPMTEPYIRERLRDAQQLQTEGLRTRTKISLKQSRCLYGVADPTGTLNEGEVFYRMCGGGREHEEDPPLFPPHQGNVVVTKNPCHHPGDVRVLRAVSNDELEQSGLYNVLVFPSKGNRSHPSDMAGSDLDGDRFIVISDKRIVENVRPCDPLDYSALSKPMEIQECLSVPLSMSQDLMTVQQSSESKKAKMFDFERLADFFVEQLCSSILGIISNLHAAAAEKLAGQGGAGHPHCRELSILHSLAVDAQKTGDVVELPPHLENLRKEILYSKSRAPSNGIISKLCERTERLSNSLFVAPPQHGATAATGGSGSGSGQRHGAEGEGMKEGGSSSCGIELDPALLFEGRREWEDLASSILDEFGKFSSRMRSAYGGTVTSHGSMSRTELERELERKRKRNIQFRAKFNSLNSKIDKEIAKRTEGLEWSRARQEYTRLKELFASCLYELTYCREQDRSKPAITCPWALCADVLISMKLAPHKQLMDMKG